MAIIQSILVGKGKGKIGNVVLSGLKGQTVAKLLNSSPSNPRTVAQTANRLKMANTVLAWQFLAIFMNKAKGLRKPLESVYNAFVRTVINRMEGSVALSRAEAATLALSLQKFSGNWFTIGISAGVGGAVNAVFNSSGLSWSPSYRAVCINFTSASGQQSVVEKAVTMAAFNAGEISFSVAEIGAADEVAMYIYDNATSKITNIPYGAGL